MATAFQANAFQINAFQIVAANVHVETPRGFDETLAAFALERRRENEEREVIQLLGLEAEMVIRAFKPFMGPR